VRYSSSGRIEEVHWQDLQGRIHLRLQRVRHRQRAQRTILSTPPPLQKEENTKERGHTDQPIHCLSTPSHLHQRCYHVSHLIVQEAVGTDPDHNLSGAVSFQQAQPLPNRRCCCCCCCNRHPCDGDDGRSRLAVRATKSRVITRPFHSTRGLRVCCECEVRGGWTQHQITITQRKIMWRKS
jgi:hypothetical protein